MTIDTIKDTQIAITQFIDSIGFDGFSRNNGQSALLKSFINSIKDYHSEILNLPSDTKLVDLPLTYRSGVYNIQPYLQESTLPREDLFPIYTNTLIDINDYTFNLLDVQDNKYIFDLSKTGSDVQNKLKVSQRIVLLNSNKEYILTGIIESIYVNSYFSVIVKNPTELISYEISYGKLDLKWNIQEYISLWTKDIAFEESNLNSWIHVKLYNLKTLYNCSWSLYYKSSPKLTYTEIAIGTDNVQPGYAYLSKANSLFKPGDYLLKSKIIKYGYYGTDMKRLEWNLIASKNYIKNE